MREYTVEEKITFATLHGAQVSMFGNYCYYLRDLSTQQSRSRVHPVEAWYSVTNRRRYFEDPIEAYRAYFDFYKLGETNDDGAR